MSDVPDLTCPWEEDGANPIYESTYENTDQDEDQDADRYSEDDMEDEMEGDMEDGMEEDTEDMDDDMEDTEQESIDGDSNFDEASGDEDGLNATVEAGLQKISDLMAQLQNLQRFSSPLMDKRQQVETELRQAQFLAQQMRAEETHLCNLVERKQTRRFDVPERFDQNQRALNYEEIRIATFTRRLNLIMAQHQANLDEQSRVWQEISELEMKISGNAEYRTQSLQDIFSSLDGQSLDVQEGLLAIRSASSRLHTLRRARLVQWEQGEQEVQEEQGEQEVQEEQDE
ncbi:MAG: hypothetical protein Q9180_000793 [Flavoplaca navasiana]